MALIDINQDPTPRELKIFGVLFAAFFALVGGLVWWQSGSRTAGLIVWAAAGLVLLVFVLVAPTRRPIYLAWSYVLYPVGYLVTLVLMGVVYYLVITPTGLLLRLFGRDPLSRKFLPGAASYWIRRKEDANLDRYFRQF